ncbi:hypothetical protein Val02_20910 [Virgisporangium aliadipatigenens]|uniref:TerD family protein n=1 Tax=Virgisporangium aliadipatigenens TaxID=741659 RepID=A0A8J4DNS5_9ACTN|nr:TerD family protein [Virgisporangium aliadipatigenens]GIJ45205.1 hypothetical protein Val02_20910 [Virgisporangium aliadipatigenens]
MTPPAALTEAVLARTLRVPAFAAAPGDGSAAARQFDVALMSAGFKLSGELLQRLSTMDGVQVRAIGARVCAVVARLVGDDKRHNAYFRDFPAGVPDTVEFWTGLIRETFGDEIPDGPVNLLALPKYGRYQHSYEELLAAHAEFVPSLKDRVTLLHPGGTPDEEARRTYLELAATPVPLSTEDLALLADLAAYCVDGPQPKAIPVREVRAVVNRARLAAGVPLLVDTVTDVLRLACAVSEGDVGLREPTRFRSLRRAERRVLLEALHHLVRQDDRKLADVGPHREAWKRLGERLHPHEYPHLPGAAEVFAVARGDRSARSFAARVEAALAGGDLSGALDLLATRPGMLVRAADRLLRGATPEQSHRIVESLEQNLARVSGRVILSLREHLGNRTAPEAARGFANRRGRLWVAPDARAPLPSTVVGRLVESLDAEIVRRLPAGGRVLVDPAVLPVALPLSQRSTAAGFGVLPRGSRTPVGAGHARFFVYWHQNARRTDFDLSALLLDDGFRTAGQLSWTSLRGYGGTHSGDITEAPDGASEFIDLDLRTVSARYILPMVHVYSGEGFQEVRESFFGYMEREAEQLGKPFEARSVRMRSTLAGTGRVALPLVFVRDDDGGWSVRWLHLYMTASPEFNAVENSAGTASLLLRAIVERSYLRVADLVALMRRAGTDVTEWTPDDPVPSGATFIGLERPEHVADDAAVYPLARLPELIPD